MESHFILKDFIEKNSLMDNHQRINVKANVTIDTENNSINHQSEIHITFKNFDRLGYITIMDSDNLLDPLIYPTTFEAKWQKIELINDEILLIKGNHKMNKEIGQYKVKITPIL